MNRFELFYPSKPYVVTQEWGRPNDAYRQFGFSLHNGIDTLPGTDWVLRAPCRMVVTEVAYTPGAGHFVIAVTPTVFDFEDGVRAYVGLTFMHMALASPVRPGTVLEAGDYLGLTGNTGFSTGPHTHLRCQRLLVDGSFVERNSAANYSFDHAPYFNGEYAVTAWSAREAIRQAKEVIAKVWAYVFGRTTT